MARVVRFHETGGPEVLQIVEETVAAPSAGEVQIKVHALGLNRAEIMFRTGQYLEAPQFPARLGYEAAGTVTAIGDNVTGFAIGDAVSTVPAFSQNRYGVYGELVNVPAAATVRHPASLSWAEAASVWMQYLTVYGALVELAQLEQGEFVLISAASSSVGLAAIQFANMLGAIPLAMTRSAGKREALLQAGARHVIASGEQDVAAEVSRITQGRGVRVIFDPVGGPMLEKLAEAAAHGGIIFQYGALSPEPTPLPLFSLLSKQLTIRGYTLFEMTADAVRLEAAKQYIVSALTDGRLKPVVARTFAFDQIVEAHRYMESNQQIGKIVVTV